MHISSIDTSRQERSKADVSRFGRGLTPRLVLRTMEQNPIGETLAKDILGFNVPKFLLCRTFQEFIDVLPLELGNTAITAASTMILPALLRHPVKALSGVKDMSLLATEAGKTLSSQAKLARLGVAFGFAFPFAAAFWALPFFRNWLTIKNLKMASFESVIGDQGVRHKPKSLEEEASFQWKQAAKIFGIGLGLGAASLFGFSLAARQAGKKQLSGTMQKAFHMFDLKGKGANQIDGMWPTFIFWSSPAYLGWIHAARGNHERREQLIKGINSSIWFFLVTPILNRTWFVNDFNKTLQRFRPKAVLKSVPSYAEVTSKYKGPLQKSLLALKDKQYGISFAITILMLSMSPQVLNIYLTSKKLYQERMKELSRRD